MDGLLKGLAIDQWYKASTAVGFSLLVLAITIDVRWLTNREVGLAGLGFFLIGLSAWKNIKRLNEFVPRTPFSAGGILSYSQSIPDPIGVCCWIAGLFSFGLLLKTALLP